MQCMYVNITYRRVEVSNKASKVNGIHTKSYCVQDWLAGGEGCTVVVWNARIDPRWCHLGFFLWLLLTKPCALRSTQPLKMSTRDFCWGKGGRCSWLMTYHPCSAKSGEDTGP